MPELSEIDKNFAQKPADANGLVFYDALCPPFSLHGVFHDGERFRRMPRSVAQAVNEGTAALHANTAGGRVRFRTDSRRVMIRADMDYVPLMPHFAYSGSASFDLYTGKRPARYNGTFMPAYPSENGYESVQTLRESGEQDVMIHFPLYSSVKHLWIGLDEGAHLAPPAPYTVGKPVVFYGSSITQGGCASRAGCCYQSLLSEKLDFDYINLGFSGNAKGEQAMADYIASLSMSAFVMDYDHNAPSVEHLEATHEPFFRTVRAAHPDLPILVMARPKFTLTPEEEKRCAICRRTVENALAAGDTHVSFLSGARLMELVSDNGTVDNCHPTDAGFLSMAFAMEPVLKTMLTITR